MKEVGDLAKNRNYYLRTRFPNLTFLFKKRFDWMNNYIFDTDEVLEVGCGIGVTKLFVKKGNLILSDVIDNPWVDRQEDALNLSYADESLDVIIANNIIHHLAHPLQFFQETDRVLKKGGRLLIQDINCSFFMQRLLRFMHIEDFNFKVNVFDRNQICTNPQNPWNGNNAIPNLLFDDVKRFEQYVPYLKIIEFKKSEFFVYICSGGISGKTFSIPLPYAVLKILDTIDNFLVLMLPMVFALQMRVVLEKK
jgi:SAM-dependent methyltransferase